MAHSARAPTHRQMQLAKVAGASLLTFWHAIDADHDGFASVRDLVAFCNKHGVALENAAAPAAPMHHQTEACLTDMYFEALALRAPTILAKRVITASGVEGAALTQADVAAAFQMRRPKLQTATAGVGVGAAATPRSDEQVVYSSQYRNQWIALLLRVVPQPFEPLAPTSSRPPVGPNAQPVRSMFEREAEHAQALQSARRTARAGAPTARGSQYHPSTYLHHAPVAATAAASYSFTQPLVRSTPLSDEHLTKRATSAARVRELEEKQWGAKKRRLHNITQAIEARERDIIAAAAFEMTPVDNGAEYEFNEVDHDDEEEEKQTTDDPLSSYGGSVRGDSASFGGGTATPSAVPTTVCATPYSSYGPSRSGAESRAMVAGEHLGASRLSLVSFRTREEFEAGLAAERLKSDALDYRQNGSAHRAAVGEHEESEEDLLSKTLLAMSTGKAAAGSPKSRPGETAAQRVARMLEEQHKSCSTSGKFKPRPQAQNVAVGLVPAKLNQPRWVNADAPANGSLSARSAAEVTYDDQGRPIRTARREALTERRTHHPGVVVYPQQRREWDQSQADMLAGATERALQAFEIPDPLDTMLSPFVPRFTPRNPTDALQHALRSTADATARTRRGPTEVQTQARGDWATVGHSPPPPGKPAFHLDFHLTSPQDERLHASRSLSVQRPLEKPTVANGGITCLAQLQPGYAHAAAPPVALLSRDGTSGDISLLPAGYMLDNILLRRTLDASRPKFSLDFTRDREARQPPLGEAHVIARDGGATTAEQAERWRQAQLGIGMSSSTGTSEVERERLLHQHTAGVVVRHGHLAAGSHHVSHVAPFTTLLGASPLAVPVPRLEQSEREAAMIAAGHAKLLRAEKQAAARHAAFAALRPSERRRIAADQQSREHLSHFPFRQPHAAAAAKA